MVVIAQRHVQRRDGTELCKESEEMGQPFWHIEQVSRNENPIGVKFPHGFHDTIMPRMVSVQV
jgi:hypothetical protein